MSERKSMKEILQDWYIPLLMWTSAIIHISEAIVTSTQYSLAVANNPLLQQNDWILNMVFATSIVVFGAVAIVSWTSAIYIPELFSESIRIVRATSLLLYHSVTKPPKTAKKELIEMANARLESYAKIVSNGLPIILFFIGAVGLYAFCSYMFIHLNLMYDNILKPTAMILIPIEFEVGGAIMKASASQVMSASTSIVLGFLNNGLEIMFALAYLYIASKDNIQEAIDDFFDFREKAAKATAAQQAQANRSQTQPQQQTQNNQNRTNQQNRQNQNRNNNTQANNQTTTPIPRVLTPEEIELNNRINERGQNQQNNTPTPITVNP